MALPDATNAAIVAAGSALLTVVVSGWINSTASDRRDAATARREADKEAKHDLATCEITCDRLRDEKALLQAELAMYRGLLAANRIPIPERSRE